MAFGLYVYFDILPHAGVSWGRDIVPKEILLLTFSRRASRSIPVAWSDSKNFRSRSTATLAEADEMAATVARTGKMLAINWPLRWYPSRRPSKNW